MSEEEIVALKERIHNENTEKADKKTEKAFLGFLSVQQNVTDMEYWLYEPEERDKLLCKFWYEIKTSEGENYCISSLKHIQYGLNRVLKKKGHNYSIIKSLQFAKSQQCLNKACANLKKFGQGYVVPYKEIKPAGN